MRNKITIAFICSLCLLYYSCQREQQESCLITDFKRAGKDVKSLDELFGKERKQTILETTDEALVGRIGKIIKRKDFFFILSEEKQIFQFNDEGKYISTLNKRGAGPDEYTLITDFAVFINEKEAFEIWISDLKKIRKYHKTTHSWEQFAIIDFPYVINKFHVINDNRILLLTGQNENCLTLSDGKGKTISSYLKSEIPFMIFKPVQFVNFGEEFVFQQGVSNNCIIYSPVNDSFKESRIVDEDSFLSSKRLQELFSKYEYDYLKELSGYSYLRTLRQVKGATLVEFFMNKKRHVSIYSNNVWRSLAYEPKEISENIDIECLSTIGVGEGTTSFIMFRNNEKEDQNPIIVEY